MFMALDDPAPASTSTIVFVYAVAFVENCLLYVIVGAALWPIAFLIVRLRTKRSDHSNQPT